MRKNLRRAWWSAVLMSGLVGCADLGREGSSPRQRGTAASSDRGAASANIPEAGTDFGGTPSRYDGYGRAKFGATEEDVRSAWGRELVGSPTEPEGCYLLRPRSDARGASGIGFMIEGGKFVRVDVDSAERIAPGGGRVGMRIDEIRQRYPRIEERPHKYVEGAKYLRRVDASGGVVVFEIDPAGTVTRWRAGVPPQIDYVEGCS